MTSTGVSASNRRAKLATFSWALWDWAEQPYPTMIQTFIFANYIVSGAFGDKDANTAALSIGSIIASVLVAVSAPVFGRRSDDTGRRKFWLLANSLGLIYLMALSYTVFPDQSFLWFGVTLYAIGSVVQETAFINYYAMLKQVTNKNNIGRVSGLAWGLGYVGGIILLLVSLVGFYLPEHPWFGITKVNSENIRVLFLFSAIWMLVFTIPLAIFVPEVKAKSSLAQESILQSYKALWAQLKGLAKDSPDTLRFLIASAIYRDGLAGVFMYGAILGSVAFGFDDTQVIYFGIAANIVAGVGAALGGLLDNRLGTKTTIVASLIGLLATGLGVFSFAFAGQITYWIGGLILCLFVGPAQASSRTFVARFTPEGREGEIFGIYQTTGKITSVLSPSFWLLATGIAAKAGVEHSAIFGILGLMVVLGTGLFLLLKVHPNPTIND